MKYDAVAFSFAGDKYIGRLYSEMDCQAFVERCMRDCGLHEDLAGSNAWYRQVKKHGWVGTPEECIRLFGEVPKGALLFILKQDGREPAKYQNDGIGNASHIGICIQRHDGAINSSSSKGKVCYSTFKNKSIRGGWNRVGLYNKFDYGKTINWLMAHGAGQPPPDENQGGNSMTVIISAENGAPVNLRQSPGGALIDRIPVGTKADVIEGGDEWSRIRVNGRTGWMKSEFLTADDSQLPTEDDFNAGDLGDGSEKVTLTFTASELSAALPLLTKLPQMIIEKVGRG